MAASGTPWFRLYSQLRGHPKVEDLGAELGAPDAHVIGYLVCLWCWVTDYAPDGDLSGRDDRRIERAAKWEGQPGKLIAALVKCGWIDGESNSYSVHHWLEYAESYKRAQKQKGKRGQTKDQKANEARTGTQLVLSGDGTAERRGDEKKGTEISDALSRAISAIDSCFPGILAAKPLLAAQLVADHPSVDVAGEVVRARRYEEDHAPKKNKATFLRNWMVNAKKFADERRAKEGPLPEDAPKPSREEQALTGAFLEFGVTPPLAHEANEILGLRPSEDALRAALELVTDGGRSPSNAAAVCHALRAAA